MNSIIVHYQEIALKGRNRPYFIAKLVRNLRRQTADLGVQDVRALMGRIEIVLGPSAAYDRVEDRLRHVFGIANFSTSTSSATPSWPIWPAIRRSHSGSMQSGATSGFR
jgi:thiamine biosynthesis protein ThiI